MSPIKGNASIMPSRTAYFLRVLERGVLTEKKPVNRR
jgi:hypothetical protein